MSSSAQSAAAAVDLSVIANRFDTYFSCFGSTAFASALSHLPFLDPEYASNLAINAISDREVLECASHHGNLGAPKEVLAQEGDAKAQAEQSQISDSTAKDQQIMSQLRQLDKEYTAKHGIKFMASAKGKTGAQLLELINSRKDRSTGEEWATARRAMFEIFMKRIAAENNGSVVHAHSLMEKLFDKHSISSASVTACWGTLHRMLPQEINWSVASTNNNNNNEEQEEFSGDDDKIYHFGSASKLLATAFCFEYFASRKNKQQHQKIINIDIETTPVNDLLKSIGSTLQLNDPSNVITILDLLSDSALDLRRPIIALRSSSQFPVSGEPLTNGHLLQDLIYVKKSEKSSSSTSSSSFVVPDGGPGVINNCAGLLVVQHIIQTLEKNNVNGNSLRELTQNFFGKLVLPHSTTPPLYYPSDEHEDDEAVESLAHGLRGTLCAFHQAILCLSYAYNYKIPSAASVPSVPSSSSFSSIPISHPTARRMLFGFNTNYDFLNTNISDGGAFILNSISNNKFIVVIGNNNSFKFKYLALQCFEGADKGKGFCIASASDAFNADFAGQGCTVALGLRGFDNYGAETNKYETNAETSQREFYRDEFLKFFKRPQHHEEQPPQQHLPALKLSESFYVSAGEVAARFTQIGFQDEFNAASLEFGARLIPPQHQKQQQHEYDEATETQMELHRRVLSPLPPLSKADGYWIPGGEAEVPSIYKKEHHNCEELRIGLHHPVSIHRIEVDFTFFDHDAESTTTADIKEHKIEVFGVLPKKTNPTTATAEDNGEDRLKLIVPKTSTVYYFGSTLVINVTDSDLTHLFFEELIVRSYPCGSGMNRFKAFANRRFP